ncbi:MAG: hypothetical protein V1676_00410 [Candidatus Diapherotrites archaeon]
MLRGAGSAAIKKVKAVRVKRQFRQGTPKPVFEGRLFPLMKIRPHEREIGALVRGHMEKIHEMQRLAKENVAQIDFVKTETGGAEYERLFETGKGSLETARKGWGLGDYGYDSKTGRVVNNFLLHMDTGHYWVTVRSALFKEGIDKEQVLGQMKRLNEEIKKRHGALMQKIDSVEEEYKVARSRGHLAMSGKGAAREYRELKNAGGNEYYKIIKTRGKKPMERMQFMSKEMQEGDKKILLMERQAYLDKKEFDRGRERHGFRTYYDEQVGLQIPIERWMIEKGILSPSFTISLVSALEEGLAREKMFGKRNGK